MIPLRDDQPSRIKPVVTVTLIVVNVLFFLYELSIQLSYGPAGLQEFFLASAFVPARLFGAPPYVGGGELQLGRALLSMFLHGGVVHIGGNMLFLWIFGDNVEDRLGHVRFVLFYLACGFVATYSQAVAQPDLASPTVGASGAIAGVLGAYLFLHPSARIRTLLFLGFFLTTVEVPALVFLPFWFLFQFISGIAALGAATSAQAGGVAWFAHIGGFIAGPLLLLALGGRRRRSPGPRRAYPRDPFH